MQLCPSAWIITSQYANVELVRCKYPVTSYESIDLNMFHGYLIEREKIKIYENISYIFYMIWFQTQGPDR